MTSTTARALLIKQFDARHVDAALKHFEAAIEKFVEEDWDGVALKAGKFVEAVTKALVLHCGKTLPANTRKFKAGVDLRTLEQADPNKYSDVVRIMVPKVCLAIYEIVNNRGGRHDAGEIDANEMDAKVVIPQMQWTLAELVRFVSMGGDTAAAEQLIEEVTNKVYPFFEKIDGRTYVNIDGLGAPDVALLLLYEAYPKRTDKKDLIDGTVRHGHKQPAASMAVLRLKTSYDEHAGLDITGSALCRFENLSRRPTAELIVGAEVIFGHGAREVFPAFYRDIERAIVDRARAQCDRLESEADPTSREKVRLLTEIIERASQSKLNI